jgi:phosphate transport system substrate-binding protein
MKRLTRSDASAGLLAAALALLLATPPADAQESLSKDAKNALRAQADRAGVIYARGKAAHYTQKFDLSGLPHYVPERQFTGWIRIHGNNYLADGMLGEYWEHGFAKFQPGIKLSYYLPTSATAFAALYYNQADLIMAHRPSFYDLLGYERILNCDPVEMTGVTGSYDVGGWENPYVILVNNSNPLKGISMKQLDGVFGAARDGGWVGTNWRPDFARGPEENIRTWGQLGLTGEWADKPIRLYGFALRYNTATDFADKVLKGSDKWNENIHTYGNFVKPDGTRIVEADQITEALARDPYGIAYNRFRGERPNIHRIPIAPGDSQAYVAHTIENLQNRSYPLLNQVYFYTTVKPGEKMDPLVREFMRYILSQEGQLEVERDGKYLPLTAEDARDQLAKLH